MATNPRHPDWERQDAVLRALNLNAVIPALWPEAQGPQSDGSGVMRWQWPDGLKVNVLRDQKGFVAWDHREAGGRVNSRGPNRGQYAGMLVQAVEGGRFPEAIQRLKQAGMLDAGFVTRQSATQVPGQGQAQGDKKAFQWHYDYARPYQPVRDYLVGQRGLPESVVKAAWDQGQIQKGYGPRDGHYILFPCRDWSQPDTTPHGPKPVGALKRWIEAYPPAKSEYIKMALEGTDKKAGWWQFSKGNAPKDILVITEQPIDALSVMAAATALRQHDAITVVGFGGQGGLTEKLVSTGKHIFIATDPDNPGLGYADEIERLAQRLPTVQSLTRCLPPDGKDWNEWWKTDRPAATQALQAALDIVREAQKPLSPFERRPHGFDRER